MASRCYFKHKSIYWKRRGRLAWDEYKNVDSVQLNNDEFLCLFRMTRMSFMLLKAELSCTSIFNRNYRYKKPRPLFQQLLVYLYCVGRCSSSGSCHEVALYFGIASGSIRNYVNNVVAALKELQHKAVCWLTKQECKDMKVCLASTGFRHCVSIADETLIPLTFWPKFFHECYYCQKCLYALNALIVCVMTVLVLHISMLTGQKQLMTTKCFMHHISSSTEKIILLHLSTSLVTQHIQVLQ